MANPNPSPDTRFKAGQSGNPGGKTEGQRAAEIESARISAELRLLALSSLQEMLSHDESEQKTPKELADEAIKMLLQGEVLKLFRDSEDRAHGTPKATTEHGGPNGGPILTVSEVLYKIHDPKIDED